MKKLLLVSVLIMIGTFVFAAGQQATDESAVAQEAEPKVLTIGMDSDPVAFDPALVSDGNSAMVIKETMEGLMAFESGTGKLIPWLAKDYTFTDEGKVVTFTLRENVTFHDGTPFDAEAVKYNFERQMPDNKTEEMPNAGTIFGNVEKVEVLGTYQIRITLKSRDVTFLTSLALNPGCEMVSPKAFEADPEAFKKHPVGTGPYRFATYVEGQYVSLKANEEYWNGRAKCDEIVFKIIPDSAVRTSELIAGSIDILQSVDLNSVSQLENTAGVEVKSTPGATISYIALYSNKEPFNNKKVRQALFMGVDREAIVTGLYGNNAVVSKGFIPPTTLGYSDDLEPFAYDPDNAQQLLSEAGYGNGLSVTMLAYNVTKNYNPAGERLAIAIQDNLKKIGVDAEVVVKPWNEFVSELFDENPTGHAIQIGWGSTINDPADFAMLLESKNVGTGLNFADWENETYDQLADKAKKTGDLEEREAIYIEMQQLANEECPWIHMSHSKDFYAYSDNVIGYAGGITGTKYYTVDKK